jgi:hypothetical protein
MGAKSKLHRMLHGRPRGNTFGHGSLRPLGRCTLPVARGGSPGKHIAADDYSGAFRENPDVVANVPSRAMPGFQARPAVNIADQGPSQPTVCMRSAHRVRPGGCLLGRRQRPLLTNAVKKAAHSGGCTPHPANAPAGSNQSSHGGDEMLKPSV